MDFTRRRFIGAALATGVGLTTASCMTGPAEVAQGPLPPVAPPIAPVPEMVAEAPAPLDVPPLIAEALAALEAHSWTIPNRDLMGVADFSMQSREPRFHIVDVATGQVRRSLLVAHGSGSDPGHTGMLQRFSNTPGSNATSRGAYVTANPYYGKYGRSQRLIGLDPDNNMALDRAIVLHGAPYVSRDLIAQQGRIGRSQGCFAFELDQVAEVMALLGEGRMIYASKLA